MFSRMLTALAIFAAIFTQTVFADYKITQRTTTEDISTEQTVYAKGVRERRETKMDFGAQAKEAGMTAEMMASFMPPSITSISQCDIKQDVSLNEKDKLFYISYYDPTTAPASRRPAGKVKWVIKGTATISNTVADSGRRQTMFGLQARWLKAVTDLEFSADSCSGAMQMRTEREGWFVQLSLDRASCPTYIPPGEGGEACVPRTIVKASQDPGFFLEGTTTTYMNGQKQMTSQLATLELSKAVLDQALFEIPKDYTEVDSFDDLMKPRKDFDMTAVTEIGGRSQPAGRSAKTVAIDFFSGSTSKINEDEMRAYIADKLAAAGLSGHLVSSQAEIAAGNFVNVIGVEIKRVKESTGAKLGGLFGRVTGNDDAAKAGDTEAEVVITAYAKDGKSVVATAPAVEKVKGKASDAVRAAIDKALPSIIAKLK